MPDVGIVLISRMHILKNFNNLKGVASAKSELINNITENGTIILNADDKFSNFFKHKSLKNKLNIISFWYQKKSDEFNKN